MPQLKVLIAGASIAGPTTAYWLAKAGASVTVIERFPSLRSGGQNIDIRTVGVTVMRKMDGMEAAVRANLSAVKGFQLINRHGRAIATMRATGDADHQSLVSEFEIGRGDLSRIIYDMTRKQNGVEYIFGESITAIHQHEKGDRPARVEFANGKPAEEFDLVIACDGATSRTRAIGLGCGVRDYIHPVNAWNCLFSINNKVSMADDLGQAWSYPPGRFTALGPHPTGTGNTVLMMRIHPRDEQDATLAFQKATQEGTGALKTFVADEFAKVGYKICEILEGMRESPDFYASEMVQVKVPSLHKGRFVLVGDAGYAGGPTGGGTSLAMAGGYVLAGELLRHKGDIAAALRGYQEQMQPLIDEFTKIPPGVPGVMAPQTAWGLWVRDSVFPVVAWGMALGPWVSWLTGFFSSAFGSRAKYPLPEYKWVA